MKCVFNMGWYGSQAKTTKKFLLKRIGIKIPALLKSFTPQLIEDGIYNKTGNYFYTLEYLPYIPLNEIFVHGKNPDFFGGKFSILSKNTYSKLIVH